MNMWMTLGVATIAGAVGGGAVVAGFVNLQDTTPGSAQTGHINVSGTVTAGKVRVGSTVAGGALVRVEDPSGSGGIYSKSGGNGVYSESTGAAGQLIGGQFVARSTSGRGVIGSATSATGATRGGIFDSKSTTGVGVYGLSSATSGTGVGVIGSATAASGTAILAINPNGAERVEIAGPNGAVNLNDGYVNRNYGAGLKAAIPIAYGYVEPNGTIDSGTGNFTVARNGTGDYGITITGENYFFDLYTTVVTGTSWEKFRVASGLGTLAIQVHDEASAPADAYFNFVVFKSSPSTLYPRVPNHGFKDDVTWAMKRPNEFRSFREQCVKAEQSSDSQVGPQ